MAAPQDRTFSAADTAAMRDALALAQLSVGLSDPNPRVGCVITTADGRVLGRGHTQAAGSAHAEPMALEDARLRGDDIARRDGLRRRSNRARITAARRRAATR